MSSDVLLNMNFKEYVEYLETESEEEIEQNSIATSVLEDVYNIDIKTQDDLDLIALVEGNPRLYAKGKAGYKNVQEKEMAWISIGKALKHPLSGRCQFFVYACICIICKILSLLQIHFIDFLVAIRCETQMGYAAKSL